MRCAALIVAAGRGERFGRARPKQYADLLGRPVLRHAVMAFLDHPAIDRLQVVIGKGDAALYAEAVGDLGLSPPVDGGPSRQASVRLGLEALTAGAPERVLIHDAARPLVSRALIDRVVAGLDRAEAVLPAVPVVDTLKAVAGDRVTGQVPREGLVRAQTPQGFAFAPLLEAHRGVAEGAGAGGAGVGGGFTDDTAVAAAAGMTVVTVDGEETNIKITESDDLTRAARLMQPPAPAYRTGLGFDVHAFASGRRLVLCGVEVPFELGLAGHSDADVALHALTDALLGSLAEGDIGSHFPPSEPRWRDADSTVFLDHARGLLEARGGRIEHLDLVLVCERPKIGPHRAAMRARLAELLDLDLDRVSLKATTSEGLGFTGRGEGIAAQAIVTIRLEQGRLEQGRLDQGRIEGQRP